MARFRVIQSGSKWVVTKNGRKHFKKRYSTKQEALQAARRTAKTGDSVQGQKLNGKWDNERTKNTFGPQGDR